MLVVVISCVYGHRRSGINRYLSFVSVNVVAFVRSQKCTVRNVQSRLSGCD